MSLIKPQRRLVTIDPNAPGRVHRRLDFFKVRLANITAITENVATFQAPIEYPRTPSRSSDRLIGSVIHVNTVLEFMFVGRQSMLGITDISIHILAFIIVFIASMIAGIMPATLASFERRVDFWIAMPIFGIAFWSFIIYLMPLSFCQILFVVTAISSLALVRFRFVAWPSARRGDSTALLLMLVGFLSYSSLLWRHHVPPGMDASMVATNTRLIAQADQLPTTYSPFAEEINFPSVNLGPASLAAVAVQWGCSPAAATLAVETLTYASLIGSVFLIGTIFVSSAPASVIAVSSTWLCREVQNSVGWGGFGTVTGVAVAIVASRLLYDFAGKPSLLRAISAGIAVGSLPMVHGVSAATWLIVVAPILGISSMYYSPNLRRYLLMSCVTVLIAGCMVAVYLIVGDPKITTAVREMIWKYQQNLAPEGNGLGLAISSAAYLARYSGQAAIATVVLACLFLAMHRRWGLTILIVTLYTLGSLVVWNARFWLLPASELLYPERVGFFAPGLVALAWAAAWRERWPSFDQLAWLSPVIAVFFLATTFTQHLVFFEKACRNPAVSNQEWIALNRCGRELDPKTSFVRGNYMSSASYLPCVAGIATTGMHLHYAACEQQETMNRERAVTHHWLANVVDREVSKGEVILSAERWAVLERQRHR